MSIGTAETRKERSFSVQPLVDATGETIVGMARKLGVHNKQVHRWKQSGMTLDQADDAATTLGFHPSEIWPNWSEVNDVEAARTLKAVNDDPDAPKWCDPPPRRHGATPADWTELCSPCLDRPGDWLRVRLFKAKTSANTAGGKARKALGAGWEVRAARVGNGSGLWVRWTGKK